MSTLDDWQGTSWTGTKELWADPMGDQVQTSEATVKIEGDVLSYTWSYEGKPQQGKLTLDAGGASFTDTWHQADGEMRLEQIAGAKGLVQLAGSYGPDADWGWRIALLERAPTGQLVLQMTNIAPWGEEARAVRLTASRD